MNMTSLQRFCKHIKSIASFDVETLNQAMARLESFGENSPAALARILVSEFHYDQDEVHRAVAKYHAFGEININPEALDNIDEDKVRKLAQKHGMLSMRESGLDRIRSGQTSIQEVLHTTSDE